MVRDIISPEIFDRILKHPKTRGTNTQSIRNAISRIHKQNHGLTMNAAAYEFAKRRGFELYRYLDSSDKESLQHLRRSYGNMTIQAPAQRKLKSKLINPNFASPFTNEANENGSIYPYIYILENSLRRVILDKFANTPDWWNNITIVHDDIQRYAAKIQQAEAKYPWLSDRGNHPIYYVGLFELFKIIEKNWKPCFSDVFDDLELLRAWIKESVPIRNLVAHNIKTRKEDQQNIKIKTDYICRLIEKWYTAKNRP